MNAVITPLNVTQLEPEWCCRYQRWPSDSDSAAAGPMPPEARLIPDGCGLSARG